MHGVPLLQRGCPAREVASLAEGLLLEEDVHHRRGVLVLLVGLLGKAFVVAANVIDLLGLSWSLTNTLASRRSDDQTQTEKP